MSRNKGTFNFAANFEGLLKSPIDARQLVGTKADLTSTATWSGSTGSWLYNGAIVAVGSDPTTSNNGVYWLCDSANYTNASSWIKAGSGVGTITGATNGITVTGSKVRLGGTLTGSTVFTDSRVTPTGLQYAADYSGTYTNRSLVDKEYVDGIASGLLPKEAVLVATTGSNIALSGLTTIDTIPLILGDRVLVKDQTNDIDNGIYSASTGTWGRTADFDGSPASEVITGSYMWVLSGATNKNTAWVLTTPEPITVGLTGLTFVFFSAVQDVLGVDPIFVTQITGTHYISFSGASVAGNGLAWSGGQFVVTGGTGGGTLTGATNGLGVSGKNVVLGGTLTGDTFIELSAGTKTNFTVGQGTTNWLGGRVEASIDNTSLSGNSAFIGARYDSINQSNINLYATTGITLNTCINSNQHTISLGDNALVYAANYCADYTNRSLVDKEYVDNSSSSVSVSGANGITKSGNYITLGGTLTGTTTISGASHNLSLGVPTNKLSGFSVNAGSISECATYITLCSNDSTTLRSASMSVSSSGTTYTDLNPVTHTGIQYAANYCTTFTNRSLVDKQYVDNAVISSTGGTFTSDITVSIASGKTFGKYVNGNIIPASGKTANQVILMSLNEPLAPTLTLTSVSDSISFGLAAKIVNLNFSYVINSLGASVASALVEYNRGAGWVTLTTTTLTPTGYTHNINDSGNRFNTTAITYRYTVVDSMGATGQTTHVVTPQAYAAPTIAPTYTGSLQSYETQTLREVGNKNTNVAGTITSNRSLVLITGYTIQRNVNSVGWTNLTTVTFAGVTPKTITTYNDTSASATATSILYRVVVNDEYTTTTGSTYTITLKYASYAGINPNGVLSSAQIVALGGQSISGSRVRTIYFYDKPSDYAYYAYDASLGLTTSAIMDGAGQQIGAWQLLIPDVSVTNYYSQTVSVHVYRSNVIGSIDNTFAFS